MNEPRSFMAILWSAVWLVLLGTVALWLFAETMSQIWGWLLLAAGLAGAAALLIVWIRRRSDRW